MSFRLGICETFVTNLVIYLANKMACAIAHKNAKCSMMGLKNTKKGQRKSIFFYKFIN